MANYSPQQEPMMVGMCKTHCGGSHYIEWGVTPTLVLLSPAEIWELPYSSQTRRCQEN